MYVCTLCTHAMLCMYVCYVMLRNMFDGMLCMYVLLCMFRACVMLRMYVVYVRCACMSVCYE